MRAELSEKSQGSKTGAPAGTGTQTDDRVYAEPGPLHRWLMTALRGALTT